MITLVAVIIFLIVCGLSQNVFQLFLRLGFGGCAVIVIWFFNL